MLMDLGLLRGKPRALFQMSWVSTLSSLDTPNRAKYWELIYEDYMDVIAKLLCVAAKIYQNLYREGSSIGAIESKLGWSNNFTNVLGYTDPQFTELMRLYLTIHSDHEGSNVSTHTSNLVGSALSDPYLSFAAAMNGLAGPLHRLANQDEFLAPKSRAATVSRAMAGELWDLAGRDRRDRAAAAAATGTAAIVMETLPTS